MKNIFVQNKMQQATTREEHRHLELMGPIGLSSSQVVKLPKSHSFEASVNKLKTFTVPELLM